MTKRSMRFPKVRQVADHFKSLSIKVEWLKPESGTSQERADNLLILQIIHRSWSYLRNPFLRNPFKNPSYFSLINLLFWHRSLVFLPSFCQQMLLLRFLRLIYIASRKDELSFLVRMQLTCESKIEPFFHIHEAKNHFTWSLFGAVSCTEKESNHNKTVFCDFLR